MYRERPSSMPAGAVVWTRTAGDGSGGPLRVLPDGCTDLIWAGGQLLVAGPDTRAHLTHDSPGSSYAALRFAPGTGPAVLGVPAHELRDLRVPLSDLWPSEAVRRLAERVADADDRGRALEGLVADRMRDEAPPDPKLSAIVAGLDRGRPVSAVARAVGLGERGLHRRCLTAFGYGPKTLARVLRLNRALDLARAHTAFAEVATVAGYADQAHLAREVKALAGVPLGVLVSPR
ncbi:helix-turn-helix domain-containing protein [Streptomyces sp. H27-D2]|uniref:helix-turn-helix domain-containing protein n=1 Tax=Streptomyces sp. H27-D2 TaxID=3046304 RepID=UPI002DBDB3BB|nr:helix-turn-helix domain-containing protein [Streptomyces sp. H27-D2]MEC4019519.1 helix-turn-helix domain-containing protein [Streptomyces sp. H27-D2]